MISYINFKINESNNIYSMKNHKYKTCIMPSQYLQYTNYCLNYDYKKCTECGIELLSGVEEIISNYNKIISERYFINGKLININDFYGLTCNEIIIKIALE